MSDINDVIESTIYSSRLKVVKEGRETIRMNSPNPLKLSKWVANEIEEICKKIESNEKDNNLSCVCSKGCIECCKQPIVLIDSEAVALKPYLENLSRAEASDLLDSVNETCNKIEQAERDFAMNGVMNKGGIDEYLGDYFALDIPCPMLDDEGGCRIYHVRPTGCWSYRVYDNPEDCKNTHALDNSIKYDDWVQFYLARLFQVKKPKSDKLKLLPYYIKDILEGRF